MRRLIILLILVSVAFGPGQTGHRTIAKIAEDNLTRKARKAVRAILGHTDLAAVSTWADEIKSDPDWDHAYNWHWVTIPYGEVYSPERSNGKAGVKIEEFIKVLKTGEASLEEQAVALKFLIHLVADIHTPLHVGNGTDRGANDVPVTWFGDSTNLHEVWDIHLIEYKRMSYTEWVHMLQRTYTPEQMAELQEFEGIEDILVESQSYHPSIYDIGDGELSYRYVYEHQEIVEHFLLAAGLRLAAILNDIYQ